VEEVARASPELKQKIAEQLTQEAMRAVVSELQSVHLLSERDAASIAITVSSVVEMRPKNAAGSDKGSKCPFRVRSFSLPLNEPCPVCGMLDTDAVDRCVDRLGNERAA
jgi:hypothetical protein